MEVSPTIEGVNRDELVEYDDDLGTVYIASAGFMPEPGHCFYYKDGKYEFCFYADIAYDRTKFDVDVKNATPERFRGASPQIDAQDFERIERNMARFFADRWYVASRKPVPAGEEFRSLKQSWDADRK